MSLSSILLAGFGSVGSGKKRKSAVDEDLDALFRSTAAPLTSSRPPKGTGTIPQPSSSFDPKSNHKRKQHDELAGSPSRSKKTRVSSAAISTSESRPSKDSRVFPSPLPNKKGKKPEAQVALSAKETGSDRGVEHALHHSSSETDDPEVEDVSELEDNTSDSSNSGDEDDEGNLDTSTLVHESLQPGSSKRTSRHKKFIPADETSEQRDLRTIFVGNIPIEVTKSRPLQKQLKRHILSSIPNSRIESIRFRSIAFQKPTTKLPSDLSDPHTQEKKGREHERERAASWRETQEGGEDNKDKKQYQTPAQKKKVAFIRGELHSEAGSVNAYVVFGYPIQGETDHGSASEALNPLEAARLAVERCDGTTFLERTIRVDRVGKRDMSDGVMGDPKRTLFVGNLDFASKEEDLRLFFEGLVAAERGPPNVDAASEDENESSKKFAWVARVRLIRDKETQLGKGFAYVQFKDRECVDEILAMEPDKLKFAKRTLRVQRCKTVPGGTPVAHTPRSRVKASNMSSSSSRTLPKAKATSAPSRASIPRGDPTLGARLSALSKDERKAAKAADPARLARRAAKKAAKFSRALESKGAIDDQERIRKRPASRKGPGIAKKVVKKRVMTDRAVAKRNAKK